MATRVQDAPQRSAGHLDVGEQPLGGYAALTGTFLALAGGFAAWFRRSGRELPERVEPQDLALLTVAAHKASRLVAKDRVTRPVRAPFTRVQGNGGPAEVDETARGRGLRRAIGELLVCPYCLDVWLSAGLVASLLVAPRFTRWCASVLATLFGADVLQIAYKKATDAL